MKENIVIQDDLIIPGHEIEISASRSGGPGGQHVNKTSSRITVRWNIAQSSALTAEQKERIIAALGSALTKESELIIHNSASRSQQQNKQHALELLAQKVKDALRVKKKRRKMKLSKTAKEARMQMKKKRSMVKQLRSKKDLY